MNNVKCFVSHLFAFFLDQIPMIKIYQMVASKYPELIYYINLLVDMDVIGGGAWDEDNEFGLGEAGMSTYVAS